MEEFRRDCCIRGYHVYKEMWEATAGEMLRCVGEPHNVQGRYDVAVKKMETIMTLIITKVVKSVFVLLATRGHDILYSDWGKRYSLDLYIALNLLFMYCAQSVRYFCTLNCQ